MDIYATGNAFLAYLEPQMDAAIWENGKKQNRDAIVELIVKAKELAEENERLKERADRHFENLKAVLAEPRFHEGGIRVSHVADGVDGAIHQLASCTASHEKQFRSR